MHNCHQPFVCDESCSCSPSQAQILLRKADMRERARSSVFSDGKTLGQAAGIALLSFSLIFGFLVAAHAGLSRAERSYQLQVRV